MSNDATATGSSSELLDVDSFAMHQSPMPTAVSSKPNASPQAGPAVLELTSCESFIFFSCPELRHQTRYDNTVYTVWKNNRSIEGRTGLAGVFGTQSEQCGFFDDRAAQRFREETSGPEFRPE